MSRDFTTNSPEETIALGRELASVLVPPKIVVLQGDLGAGKTLKANLQIERRSHEACGRSRIDQKDLWTARDPARLRMIVRQARFLLAYELQCVGGEQAGPDGADGTGICRW